jgi:hypothetical protein
LQCELLTSRRGRKRGTRLQRDPPENSKTSAERPAYPTDKVPEENNEIQVDPVDIENPESFNSFNSNAQDSSLDVFFNPPPDSNLLSFPFPNIGDMTESFISIIHP